MSKKCTFLFKNLFLFFALVSLIILTACEHHHHHHNNNNGTSSTSSVNLSIDATDFNVNSSLRRQTNTDSDFAVTTTGYDNGKLMTTLNDVKAIASGTKYECKISGLIVGYDYRFSFKYKDTVVMQNQISKSELQNDAEIPLDVDTSIKTLAYDSWLSKNPSNASFGNFEENCANQGIVKPEDFRAFIAPDDYKAKLAQIAKGEKVSVPTKDDVKSDEINKISTKDAEKESSAILGTWYLYTEDGLPVAATDKDEVITITFNSDKTFSWLNFDMEGCPDSGKPEYYQTGELEFEVKGTWKYSNGVLTLKTGEVEAGNPIKVENDSLILTNTDDETAETTTSVYKKTKNSFKPTIEKALEGDWFLNKEDNLPVVPNSRGHVETLTLNSDGTFLWLSYNEEVYSYYDKEDEPEYWKTQEELEESAKQARGTWKYNHGSLILKTDDKEITRAVTISNGVLSLTDTDEKTSEKSTSVYKKLPGSYQPAIVKALIGTWYLNAEDNYDVVPNASNEVETWIFNDDGSFVANNYELDSDNTDYWQTGDNCETVNGYWTYDEDKGSVYIIIEDGDDMNIPISIKDGVLTTTEVDEETSEKSHSVFKKTKPSAK